MPPPHARIVAFVAIAAVIGLLMYFHRSSFFGTEGHAWFVGLLLIVTFALPYANKEKRYKTFRTPLHWRDAVAIALGIGLFVYGLYQYTMNDWARVGWTPMPADRYTPRWYATQYVVGAPLLLLVWADVRGGPGS